MNNKFSVTLTKNPKAKPDPDNLPFGRIFTDHMFVMDYDQEKDGTTAELFLTDLFPSTRPVRYFTMGRKCLKVSKPIRQKKARCSSSDLT